MKAPSWALWWTLFLAFAGVAAAGELPAGTLLFLENCSSVVERTTRGEIAHVALVFPAEDSTWVYEATPAKVRRVRLDEYLTDLARMNERRKESRDIRVLALQPSPKYSAEEAARMRAFLDGQIGRRYSVKNYIRGKPYDGIHCAELTASTLNASGRYAFAEPYKIHPQALYESLLATHASPELLDVPLVEEKEPWLVRWQRKTVGWLTWCRWSWREAWLFLW